MAIVMCVAVAVTGAETVSEAGLSNGRSSEAERSSAADEK
jgi:hypothetical protein